MRNVLVRLLTYSTLAVLAGFLVCGCTYNQITFEPNSVRLSDKVTVEPGQGGDSSDSGNNESTPTGGAGKLSPGGSNLIDGMLSFGLVIQQGGETPASAFGAALGDSAWEPSAD